jgi:glutamate-1-semialdehyde 2,1-aminomutase
LFGHLVNDVLVGFRINLAGSHVEYGFKPDIMCFGKANANGHPIAALTGVEALKHAAGDAFYTGTQFFNAGPMAACLATLQELVAIDGALMITEIGTKLRDGLIDVAQYHGYDLRITGAAGMRYFRIDSEEGFDLHARWISERFKRGAYKLNYHNNFVSTAHTETDLKETCDIADQAFAAMRP